MPCPSSEVAGLCSYTPGSESSLTALAAHSTLECLICPESSDTGPDRNVLFLLLTGPHRPSSLFRPHRARLPRPYPQLLHKLRSHAAMLQLPSPSQPLGSPTMGEDSSSPRPHTRTPRLPRCTKGKWASRFLWPSPCQEERPKRTGHVGCLPHSPRGTRTQVGGGEWSARSEALPFRPQLRARIWPILLDLAG